MENLPRASIILGLTVFSLHLPVTALAEIYKCDGKWTNRPCNGAVEGKIAEVVSEEESDSKPSSKTKGTSSSSSATSEPFAPRYEALRHLKKTSDNYSKTGGVAVSKKEYEAVKKLCMDRARTTTDCKEAVATSEASLKKKNIPQE